jgi:murein DD-endopeptidase MepM/ murein hydrolase activator NlpD
LTAVLALAVGVLAAVGIALQSLPSEGEASQAARNRALAPLPATPAIPAAVRKTEAGPLVAGPFHPVQIRKVDYGDFAAHFDGGRNHPGQDIFAPRGTPLVAVRDAVVIDRGKAHSADSGGRGNFVALYARKKDVTYVYMHLDRPSPMRRGERVRAGERVGQLGCTGSCEGYHLHFEIRLGKGSDGKAINPLPQLRRWKRAPGSS